jgi:hypothetical protein
LIGRLHGTPRPGEHGVPDIGPPTWQVVLIVALGMAALAAVFAAGMLVGQ